MNTLKPGTLVTHKTKGLGKVVAVEEDNVHVFFIDRPEQCAVRFKNASAPWLHVSEVQSHPLLDHTPPFTRVGSTYQLPVAPLSLESAMEQFRRTYPQGFHDPGYLGDEKDGERNYKLWAHEAFVRELGDGKGRALLASGDAGELRRRLLEVDRVNNLLHPSWDKGPLRDGLAVDDAALCYFRALFEYIDSPEPTEDGFVSLVSALSQMPQPGSHVDSWPVATVFPFLADPTRDVFLRPTQAKKAAELMAFELNYDTAPNWRTYSSWLCLAHLMLERLAPQGARDLIDVQSFLYLLTRKSGSLPG